MIRRRTETAPGGIGSSVLTGERLEDLPNVGERIAADLRAIGITTPAELALRDPWSTYSALEAEMGPRFDPCVLYTLLAVDSTFRDGSRAPWWSYTEAGRQLLKTGGPQ